MSCRHSSKRPAKVLEGESFLPVLLGKKTEHKRHVFGIMTTRGIINGSPHYGIRSVRSRQYKYIRNLTPDVPFRNVAMRSPIFQSWQAKAERGDADAAEKVRRYQQRPSEELYDVSEDPTEWSNLADDPRHEIIKADLRRRLDAWMQAQGDQGQATELEALKHQARNRGKKRRRKD